MKQEILTMPKIDLHCHLDGSLSPKTISELLGRDVKREELQVSEECKSLAEYLEKFDLPLECLQTPENLKKAAKEFVFSLEQDHVKYVEVRFAPMLSARGGMSCRRIMEAVLEGLKEGTKETGIYTEAIACMMRHHSGEDNFQMLKECREFLGEGLCAVDLAGDEAGFPTKQFYEVFMEAKRLGYPFTIHGGECGDVKSVLLAAEWGARRIGHGIAMKGCPDVQRMIAQKRIAIEMCPISNYQTKALPSDQPYPVREFADAGVLVTVNTDNRTVSNTSISKEMSFLTEKSGIAEEELWVYEKNAVEAAFCDDGIKHELWKLFR